MFMGERFERLLTNMAKDEGADSIICTHSHFASLRMHNNVMYANCDDWIDSLTVITEDRNGQIELFKWTPEPNSQSRSVLFSDKHFIYGQEIRIWSCIITPQKLVV